MIVSVIWLLVILTVIKHRAVAWLDIVATSSPSSSSYSICCHVINNLLHGLVDEHILCLDGVRKSTTDNQFSHILIWRPLPHQYKAVYRTPCLLSLQCLDSGVHCAYYKWCLNTVFYLIYLCLDHVISVLSHFTRQSIYVHPVMVSDVLQ